VLAPPPPHPWHALGLDARPWPVAVTAEMLQPRPEHLGCRGAGEGNGPAEATVTAVELVNAVITSRTLVRLPVREGVLDLRAAPDLCLAVLLSPPGPAPARPVARALVRGLGAVAGLATTYTAAFAPLVLGRSPAAMMAALSWVAEAGAGIALFDEEGERFFLPLEVAGVMTDLPIPELARRCAQLESLLRQRGYEVIEASDGEEALLLAEEHAGTIDMMISDVIMPGLDGPSLLKKARPFLGDAPVMFISGYAESDFSDLLQDEVGVSFLPKPLDIKTLAERVKQELRGE